MQLQRYLDRIRYSGSTEPSLGVLDAVHRYHACNITYENLDVGLGDGILEPIPLREGTHQQFGRSFQLQFLGSGEWRFHNRTDGLPPSYDFVDDHNTESRLAQTCSDLQSDPESMFRQNLICQRMSEDGGTMLLGRVLRSFDPARPRRLLQSEAELVETLSTTFGLRPPPLGDLWQRVQARHIELFGDTPVEEIRFGPSPDET